jgi:hypothetical protein
MGEDLFYLELEVCRAHDRMLGGKADLWQFSPNSVQVRASRTVWTAVAATFVPFSRIKGLFIPSLHSDNK